MKFTLKLLLPVVHLNGKFAKFQAAYLDDCVLFETKEMYVQTHIYTHREKIVEKYIKLKLNWWKSECHLQYTQMVEIRNDEIMQC